MKKLKIFLLIFLFVNLSMPSLFGQDSDRYMLFGVHEDVVYPAKFQDYEKVINELVENVNKYKVKELKWITTNTNDFRYLYVYPVANMAEMDNDNFKILADKMGADKLGDLFERMDKCYAEHFNYMLMLDKKLTYMPGGITQTPAGQNYRRFYYVYFTPSEAGKLEESLMAVKDLYTKKGSKQEYRVYRSGFGAPGDFYMIAVADKDGLSYETNDAANNKLIGNDAEGIFLEMMKHVRKFQEVTGRMRPDLEPSVK
ncbi:MAG TPA: hypothetical protein PLU37_06940 [Chitinophagaceae bacterium]|nr:hypothetical protein [Chitinophagaceae bacterium]MCB9056364.1 hypothetical protein [Chitinophagales bacterium]HPG11248.1 hypothetical protein [Chitinophagaceae bacterium]HRX93274.1 hypothetical protein [Chitinophagaceae bacterium]